MNYTVILKELGVNEVIDIVHELVKEHNLVLNKDFEYYYNPPEYNFMNVNESIPRHTKFRFKDGKYATFLTLKYGN